MTSTRTNPAEAVEVALHRFFAARRDEATEIGPAGADAVAELEAYVLRGGKRVRPTFAWLGRLGAGGDENGATAEAVVGTGAAMELFHASALIHHDVIDASPTRRGTPAAHVRFADRHRDRCWNGDAELFGTGAAIAGADDELVAAYRAFGSDIGIAFQQRDDLLGVFGASAETGRPSGGDLIEGKRTMLFAAALQYADEQDRDAAKFLRATIGTPITDDELTAMREVITTVGVVDHSERDITRRTERALTALQESSATGDAKEQLTTGGSHV